MHRLWHEPRRLFRRYVVQGMPFCRQAVRLVRQGATPVRPAASVGLAVRNNPHGVGRCVESVLSQEFADLELVICDNASDDGTAGALKEYARADRRVDRARQHDQHRLAREHEARPRALARHALPLDQRRRLARAKRLAACVGALESRPDAIGVTTRSPSIPRDHRRASSEYRGEFPTSPDPARRFERMLWFFHAGDARYDPIYGIYRRIALRPGASVPRSAPIGC